MGVRRLAMLIQKVRHLRFWKYTLSGICLLCVFAIWLNLKENASYEYSNVTANNEPVNFGTDTRNNWYDHVINYRRSIHSNSSIASNKTTMLIEKRSKALMDVCKNKRDLPNLQDKLEDPVWHRIVVHDRLYVNKQRHILYCSIPKIGCSFWKRLLKVIDESNSKHLHLYDISGNNAHHSIPESMTLNNTPLDDLYKIITSFTRFMFVRDPFSRLFSSYVDKIFVPTGSGFGLIDLFAKLNLTGITSLLWNKISFADFCAFFAESVLLKKVTDPHYLPMTHQCDPCVLNFTFIGKMETFMNDTSNYDLVSSLLSSPFWMKPKCCRYPLQEPNLKRICTRTKDEEKTIYLQFKDILHMVRINFTQVIGDVDISRINDLATMRDVIERVYRFMETRNSSRSSQEEAKERLWRHFQIRGYISKAIPFPLHLQQNKDTSKIIYEYTAATVQAYELSGHREDRLQQREEAMLEAYSTVPHPILDKLSQIFAEDCLLFDYSCNTDKYLNGNTSHFYFRNMF